MLPVALLASITLLLPAHGGDPSRAAAVTAGTDGDVTPTNDPQEEPTTIFFAAEGAPTITLIGDSTLTGVRWYDEFDELERFDFVFDAESCRRTVQTSCWSREGYRATTALDALERLADRNGDTLIVMSGYNDPGSVFEDSVDSIVEEAQRQGIDDVIWLTLRTSDVSYEEPTHEANADVYRADNEILYAKANGEYAGYLHVADWASHAIDESSWFEADGVHLTPAGARAVTAFIAESVDAVLAGEDITNVYRPWETLAAGDTGEAVALVQEALIEEVNLAGGADGVYGISTVYSVNLFQEREGLPVTGEVDNNTAIALGVHEPDPDVAPPTTTPEATVTSMPDPTPAVAPVATAGQRGGFGGGAGGGGGGGGTAGDRSSDAMMVAVLLVGVAALAVVMRRHTVVEHRRAAGEPGARRRATDTTRFTGHPG